MVVSGFQVEWHGLRAAQGEWQDGQVGPDLQDGRPETEAAAVFVRADAPFRALRSNTVSVIVARALKRAGVIPPSRGAAHLLRHSFATSLLRQGASLQDIADVLRHRSVTTTQIYAKVDVTALRQIAQPWPGASSC